MNEEYLDQYQKELTNDESILRMCFSKLDKYSKSGKLKDFIMVNNLRVEYSMKI